jgi:hypothetical protein
MKLRIFLSTLILVFAVSASARADVVRMKDGTTLEGVIKKVAAGKVMLELATETTVLDILAVESMDFTTPHLVGATDKMPVEHFLKNVEAQEIVENLQKLDQTSDEIQKLLKQINAYWTPRQPISAEQAGSWSAAKETFREPLARYQEILNDLYFHVLAKVDEYNLLMKSANQVYIGVKGPFNVGSPLVSKEMRQLPLKKYVPGAWYDTIFYEGYNLGYDEGSANMRPRNTSN